MKIKHSEQLYDLLEAKFRQYNTLNFIEDDPITIPHQFSKKEDIEISGFLAATIAWGQRKTIIKNAKRLLTIMDYAPYDFILNHHQKDLDRIEHFVHRTFNLTDLQFFLKSLQNIYRHQNGLELVFNRYSTMSESISNFKETFFLMEHQNRTRKHVADPKKGSTAKRINMFLRWMVRKDNFGVDFGIWNTINSNQLMMPLDVHTANVGRQLGLLKRKQNNWKAVEELTNSLRVYDQEDPVKYDFALFGLGVNKEL